MVDVIRFSFKIPRHQKRKYNALEMHSIIYTPQ
jgi:hypothetical protein